MKKFIKHSSVIAAALLSVAPIVAASGTVKADTTANVITNTRDETSKNNSSTPVKRIEELNDKNVDDQEKAADKTVSNEGNTVKKTDNINHSTGIPAVVSVIRKCNVYDGNGKPIFLDILKPSVTCVLVKSDPVLIAGHQMYQIGDNQYVKVANSKITRNQTANTPATITITAPSYIYNESGRRTSKALMLNESKSTEDLVFIEHDPVTIAGHQMYQIGDNRYVKVEDVVDPNLSGPSTFTPSGDTKGKDSTDSQKKPNTDKPVKGSSDQTPAKTPGTSTGKTNPSTTDSQNKPATGTTPDNTPSAPEQSASSSTSDDVSSTVTDTTSADTATTGSTTTTGTTTTTNSTQTTTNSNNTTANNNSSADSSSSTSTSQRPADNNSTSTTSTSTTLAAKPVVRLAKRSYVYTKSGKIARRNGKRVVLKKSSTRSLSNAKLVTIKGQKYYQIGKNQYVKASNVIAPIRKANVRAVVKGRKNARVRAYTSTGKRTRKYLSGRKSYKFTARRSIKGKTYYKVSGRNLWIPASKLNIR